MLLIGLLCAAAPAQESSLVLRRDGRVISLVPYAPNIVRVTMSNDGAAATSEPGYGIIAHPSIKGWTHERDAEGYDVYRSARMVVRVSPDNIPAPRAMPLDALNLELRSKFFPPVENPYAPHNDSLSITTADGKMLLHMRNWTMAQESANVAASDPIDKGFSRVAAAFDSPADEHYYGLGQQQKGWMDLRDHEIRCWHDYGAVGGEDVCVPFMVSSRGYGLVWDNPSKTTIDLGFNSENVWSSEVGNRVSYFVIAGNTSNEIYEGYRPVKPLADLIHLLVGAAGRDGNFLLNVGPRPDGQIEPSQAARIREIGRWLQINGESIYGTRGGPWLPGAYGVSTHKGRYLYIHLLRAPQGSTLSLPALPIRVAAASLLNGPALKFTESDRQLTIDLPSGKVDAIDTVIKLELDEPWTTSAVVPVTDISGSR